MPRAIAQPVRRDIWRRWRRGESPAAIAQALGLAPRTARNLVQRLREAGRQALAPDYRPGGGSVRSFGSLRARACALRREHPTWGAELIRQVLRGNRSPCGLPSARTLQRWFQQENLGPAPRGRRTTRSAPRASRPHAVWQMDASEQIALATGRRVCWLRLVDEHTGAVLMTRVFSLGPIPKRAGGGRADLPAPSVFAVGTP